MAPELFGTHVTAIDFGSEAHVDARDFLGKDSCPRTETDGEELCGFLSIFWQLAAGGGEKWVPSAVLVSSFRGNGRIGDIQFAACACAAVMRPWWARVMCGLL